MSRRLVLALAALGAAACLASGAGGATVQLDRTRVSARIGQTFTFTTTIGNTADQPVRGLVAHLNVLSSDPNVYVDPEDWSSQRTQYLPPLPARGSTRLTWKVQAVNSGPLTIYVAVLPGQGGGLISVSRPLRLEVAQRRTLNSGGVLPLALGIPGLIGLGALGLRVRRPRS